jgi:hypothetical protein
MMLVQYSADEFRRRLAGCASPEKKFDEEALANMQQYGISLIRAIKDVFGSGLDLKTVWERINNGLKVSAAKSAGSAAKFLASLIEYVKADVNVVVGSKRLRAAKDLLSSAPVEWQRQFINACVENRILWIIEARDAYMAEKASAISTPDEDDAENMILEGGATNESR